MKKRKGFTLMETVVSLILISMIASYTFSSLNNNQKYIIRGYKYAEVMYTALADVNRGVEVEEITDDIIRKTTVEEDGDLKLITTTVIGNRTQGEHIKVKFVRYGE